MHAHLSYWSKFCSCFRGELEASIMHMNLINETTLLVKIKLFLSCHTNPDVMNGVNGSRSHYIYIPDSSSDDSSVLEPSVLEDESSELLVYSLLSDSLSACVGCCLPAYNVYT